MRKSRRCLLRLSSLTQASLTLPYEVVANPCEMNSDDQIEILAGEFHHGFEYHKDKDKAACFKNVLNSDTVAGETRPRLLSS